MCMEKDDKVKTLIAPFADWNIGQLAFERVMFAIDAIVERRIENLKNEITAKIQKLQIEKTFPPKIINEGENKDVDEEEVRKKIEKGIELGIYAEVDEEEEEEEKLEEFKSLEIEFKCTIEETLTKNFVSELNTLTDSEYYNDVKWFINLPSYTTNSFHDYCRALRKKVTTLINSVNNDPNSNAFYVDRRKVDVNTVIPTMLLFDPKAIDIRRIVRFVDPSEYNKFDNDDINLTIIDSNGDKNVIKLKYHHGYSIIECDNGNPNFMLFDPINYEYVLFYKSHKWLECSCDVNKVYYDNKKEVIDENHAKKYKTKLSSLYGVVTKPEVKEDKRIKTRNELKRKYGNAIGNAIASVTNEEVNEEKPCEKSKKESVHLWYCGAEVTEDKRIKTRNKLKELFGGVIMTITNERDVNENFTYSNSDLQTLKKNIRKYIRNLICTIPESEPLYIYSNKNKHIEKPITCYNTINYKIIPSSISNNPWFDINIICETYDITIPILFFDRSTYFLSVRNNDSENKTYNFAIVNTKTKEFVIFTKDKFVFDGWKLEITAER